eukprot:NODE_714_length_4512_cov_0.872876.p5 type:complete len:100 gc:universal NODE_714_length_4512_cov_0.872876:3976-3677(-)
MKLPIFQKYQEPTLLIDDSPYKPNEYIQFAIAEQCNPNMIRRSLVRAKHSNPVFLSSLKRTLESEMSDLEHKKEKGHCNSFDELYFDNLLEIYGHFDTL